MIGQRIGAHQAPASHRKGGRVARRFPAWRHKWRSRALLAPPPVIREPEASWWAIQAELDEPAPPSGPTTTIATLRQREAEFDAVVARLAVLAAADELLVILGSTPYPSAGSMPWSRDYAAACPAGT